MDPVTVVGLIATCVTIGKHTFSIGLDIKGLRGTYKDADRDLDCLTVQISSVKAAIDEISATLHSSPVAAQEPLLLELCETTRACIALLGDMREWVNQIKAKSQTLNFWSKTKMAWGDRTVKELQVRLGYQVQALQVLQQVLQRRDSRDQLAMLSSITNQDIINKAKDCSSSLVGDKSSVRETLSTSSQTTGFDTLFAFDHQLLETGVYRSAFAALLREQAEKGTKLPEQVESEQPRVQTGNMSRQIRSQPYNPTICYEDSEPRPGGVVPNRSSRSPAPRHGVEPRSDGSIRPLHLAAQEGHGKAVERANNSETRSGHRSNMRTLIDQTPNTGVAGSAPTIQGVAPNGQPFTATMDTLSMPVPFPEGQPVHQVVLGINQHLQQACRVGHAHMVRRWLDAGADTEGKDNDGCRPLHLAAEEGHIAVVLLLLQRHAAVNTRGEHGYTPLHLACRNGREVTARILLEAGADVEAKSREGIRPLHLAVINGFDEVVQLLLQRHAAVDTRVKHSYTPLHLACLNGLVVTARILLDAGADIEAKDSSGARPLHLAATQGYDKVVQLLLQDHAAVDPGNEVNDTPLHLACLNGQVVTAHVLINAGADIQANSEGGVRPLHLAACRGYNKLVQLLLERQADVDPRDEENRTPLHLACRYGRKRVVRSLLRNGAIVDEKAYVILYEKKSHSPNTMSTCQNLLDAYADNDLKKRMLSSRRAPAGPGYPLDDSASSSSANFLEFPRTEYPFEYSVVVFETKPEKPSEASMGLDD